MSQYEPGFAGKIANTYQESTPSWPELPKALGGPNVITIVFDDMGFAHPSCFGSEIPTVLACRSKRFFDEGMNLLFSENLTNLKVGTRWRSHYAVIQITREEIIKI